MEDLQQAEYLGFLIIIGFCLLGFLCLRFDATNMFFWRWFLPHNTSLWELGRLMFSAIILQSIIQYFAFGKMYDNFFFAKGATLFLAPIIFIGGSFLIDYIFGNIFPIVHILMFVLSLALGQMASYQFLETNYFFPLMNGYAIFGMIMTLLVLASQLYATKHFQAPIFKPISTFSQLKKT